MRPSATFFVDEYEPPPAMLLLAAAAPEFAMPAHYNAFHDPFDIGVGSGGGGGGDETPGHGDAAAAADADVEVWRPRPVKSRRLELEAFGPSPGRANCFGCIYLGDNEPVFAAEHLRRLKQMIQSSLGVRCWVDLAKAVHAYYELHIRGPMNARLDRGAAPLPPWPEAQILDCIRGHNLDPLTKQAVRLSKVEELQDEVYDCCMEVSSKTGASRPNKHNIESFERLVKLEMLLQKQDASKMAFAAQSGSGHSNREVLSQGPIATHTKQVHSFMKIK